MKRTDFPQCVFLSHLPRPLTAFGYATVLVLPTGKGARADESLLYAPTSMFLQEPSVHALNSLKLFPYSLHYSALFCTLLLSQTTSLRLPFTPPQTLKKYPPSKLGGY